MESIAFLLALVGCTLISTAAGSETDDNSGEGSQTAIEKLVLRWKSENSEPMDVATMLNEHPNKGDVIYMTGRTGVDQIRGREVGYTVEVLTELCRESLDNCSYDRFKFMSKVKGLYDDHIPQLVEYVKYCRYNKLKYYCLANIDKVAENLSNEITDTERLDGLWKTLGGFIIDRLHIVEQRMQALAKVALTYGEWEVVARQEKYHGRGQEVPAKNSREMHDYKLNIKMDHDSKLTLKDRKIRGDLIQKIRNEYSQYKEQKCKTENDPDEQCLAKLNSSAKKYADIYRFLYELSDEDESGPKLNKETSIDLFKFGRVATFFR